MGKNNNKRMIRIRHAYNTKYCPIREFDISVLAEDLLLISRILPIYVSFLDGFRKDIQYLVYYRNKLLSIAKNLSEAEDPDTEELPCAYGSLKLIISILRDAKSWTLYFANINAMHVFAFYYNEKFFPMADNLSKQISYDYDVAVEKCRKKAEKQDADSDVGDEAMSLMVKKNRREAEYQKKKREEKERSKK